VRLLVRMYDIATLSPVGQHDQEGRLALTHNHTFPPDILILIFKQIHYAHSWRLYSHDCTTESFSEDVFPSTVASVCSSWKEAACSVPVFWTNINISVGRSPTPLSTIQSHVTYSDERPLDIRVRCCSHRSHELDIDTHEAERVHSVFGLLFPHIHRWRTLFIDLHHSSSIFLAYFDQHGVAEQLVDLRIEARSPATATLCQKWNREEALFRTPVLETLWLDTRIFHTGFIRTPSTLCTVKHLTLAQGQSAHPHFSVNDLVKCLDAMDLSSLHLVNLLMLCDHTGDPYDDFFVETIVFEGLDAEVLVEFYRLINDASPQYVVFKRCSLPVWLDLRTSASLRFVDIAEDEDMKPLMDGWSNKGGYELIVERCPGFDTALLGAMAQEGNGGRWLCSHMTTLMIYSCSKCAYEDIALMLVTRTLAYFASGSPDVGDPRYAVRPVEQLGWYGLREKRLSDAEKAWLRRKVRQLYTD